MVYGLINALIELNLRVISHEVEIDQIKRQLPVLIEAYLDYSREAYQLEKIEYFKNILVNGAIDYNRELDEKINIFNIISSLTIGEIEILKVFYWRDGDTTQSISIEVEELEITVNSSDKAYLKQLCGNLVGKGLLFVYTPSSTLDGRVNAYYKGEYVDRLIEYIKNSS